MLERSKEMRCALYEAVFAGDIGRAQNALDEMLAVAGESHAGEIMRARRRARPEPSSVPPLAKAIVLPQPGADPRAVFGGPRR